MAGYATTTAERHQGLAEYEFDRSSDEAVEQRLTLLRELNEELERENATRDRDSSSEFVSGEKRRTLSYEKAFALFGVMLGVFPPAAFFLRFLVESKAEAWLFGVTLIVNIIAAVVGYFTGKAVGRIINNVETGSWWSQILLTPVIGLVWGIITGMASGVILFIVGAVFGGVIGGLVGAVALPAFYFLHKLTGEHEAMRLDRFLPLALGVALVVSGIIFRL